MVNINQYEVLEFVKKLGIEKLFTKCVTNNSALGNAYHEMNHTIQMMYHLNKACIYYNMTIQTCRHLMIAGLFHDVNHSGGKLTDSENVKNAIIALDNLSGNLISEEDKKLIKSYIEVTEYPYVIADDKLTIGQQIIRDCDILVSFSSDYFTQVCCGLYHEFNMTNFNIFLQREEEFLRTAFSQLRTEYAVSVLSENILSFHQHVKLIKNIFNESI